MTHQQHPEDRIIRHLVGDPKPPPGSKERVEAALMAEITQPAHRSTTRRPSVRALAAATAAAVIAVVLILQPFAQRAAVAALEAIAEVAEIQDPLSITDETFAYTKSVAQSLASVSTEGLEIEYDKDRFRYMIRTDREVWTGIDGTQQVRTTNTNPTFFAREDEVFYYRAGLDLVDQLNFTQTSTVSVPMESWPADQAELDDAIRAQLASERNLPFEVKYLDVALGILRESLITPQQRASTIRLIASLNNVEIDKTVSGVSAFYIEYQEREVDIRWTFHIDQLGSLVYEELLQITEDSDRGIPPNTTTFKATYQPLIEVDTLNSP